MKTTMKLFTYGLMIFTLVITSCSKDGEDGATGPAGIAGIDGTDGSDGTDGTDGTAGTDGVDGEDGNADVRIFEFDSKTFTTSTSYLMPNVSQQEMGNSLVLAYFGTEVTDTSNNIFDSMTSWVNVPGTTDTFISQTRIDRTGLGNISENKTDHKLIITLRNFNGSPHLVETTFEKFKIILAPANLSGKNSTVDFTKMSYEEVIEHFGIEE